MTTITTALYQYPLGTQLTHESAALIKEKKPHFICFPEYFFVNRSLGNHSQTPHNMRRQHTRLSIMSRELDTVVIGGTMPELADGLLYNTTYVYDRGKQLGYYRKRTLFFAEEGVITPGDEFKVFEAYGIRFGVLICADVFKDESFLTMKEMGAQVIFIPTFSLKREEAPEEKFKRDTDIFVRGAQLADAVLVKVCGVKSPYKDFLQARSLVATKDGVQYRVQPDEEDTSMIIFQDIKV